MEKRLKEVYGEQNVRECDVISYVMYPKVSIASSVTSCRRHFTSSCISSLLTLFQCSLCVFCATPHLVPLQVYDEWQRWTGSFGDVSVLPTKYFSQPVKIGEEISFEIEKGKTLYIRLKAVGEMDDTGHREVRFLRAGCLLN